VASHNYLSSMFYLLSYKLTTECTCNEIAGIQGAKEKHYNTKGWKQRWTNRSFMCKDKNTVLTTHRCFLCTWREKSYICGTNV